MAPVLEEHIKGRQFLLGDKVSVADFAMAYTRDWANELQLLEGFSQIKRYMDRMYARPHAAMRISKAFESLGAPWQKRNKE